MQRNLRTPLRAGLAALSISGLLACTTTPLPPLAPLPPPVAPSAPPAASVPPPAPPAAFIRPSAGGTIARFDGRGNKGIDIAGEAGDPVLASADGRVAYVGSELRGYGTMVIVQHNETFITAYAHVQRALVREKDVVVKGQKIAEMGMSGTDRVKLHFELRKLGVAVDPEPYLQGRLR